MDVDRPVGYFFGVDFGHFGVGSFVASEFSVGCFMIFIGVIMATVGAYGGYFGGIGADAGML